MKQNQIVLLFQEFQQEQALTRVPVKKIRSVKKQEKEKEKICIGTSRVSLTERAPGRRCCVMLLLNVIGQFVEESGDDGGE